MPSKSKLIRKDKGAKLLFQRTKKGGTVDVGILVNKKYPDSSSKLAEVAATNEFGSENVPERSFIRATLSKHRGSIKALQASLLKRIISGKLSRNRALEQLGAYVKKLIKQAILDMDTPSNAAATIANKGFDNPLVETKMLHDNIAYEVNK